MEIQQIQHGDVTEVIPSGRLDEYWSSHLESYLEQVIRSGARRIHLNLSSITYLSSAGIGMLMKCHKRLREIDGSIGVVEPSDVVKKILDLMRLSPILLVERLEAPPPAVATSKNTRSLEHHGAAFKIQELQPGASMKWLAVGDSSLMERCGYRQEDVSRLAFSESAIGLGIGAFGGGFDECRGRFGEFLAVAGAAAYLPTDGSNVCDYMLSEGSFIPEVNVLCGLACEGSFAHLARFETSKESRSINLSDIIDACLRIAESDTVAVAMIVETAGLVGAALRRSPAASPGAQLFSYPEIRDWISFTAEPAYAGSLCVLSGVAARDARGTLQSMLRPIGKGTDAVAHFHAAAFRYQPLRNDELDLRTTIRALFESRSLQGILHLLADPRASAGAQESQFVRGACWIAPLRHVQDGQL